MFNNAATFIQLSRNFAKTKVRFNYISLKFAHKYLN